LDLVFPDEKQSGIRAISTMKLDEATNNRDDVSKLISEIAPDAPNIHNYNEFPSFAKIYASDIELSERTINSLIFESKDNNRVRIQFVYDDVLVSILTFNEAVAYDWLKDFSFSYTPTDTPTEDCLCGDPDCAYDCGICFYCNSNPCVCPCDFCGELPCVCDFGNDVTFVQNIKGGNFYNNSICISNHYSQGELINANLIRAIKFTFDFPNRACGEALDPDYGSCNQMCMTFALNSDFGFNSTNFCYALQPEITIEIDGRGTGGWLKFQAASWIEGFDGTVTVFVLDKDGNVLKFGDNMEDDSFKLGYVTGGDKITIADALTVLKHLAGISILKGDSFEAALITPQSQAARRVSIGDVLEILKHLAGIESKLD
jgi:hypothetical protein